MEGFEEDIEEARQITMGAADQGDVEKVLDMVYHKFSYDLFQYGDVKENNGNLLLTFRRKHASYCENCKRVHENENPFVTVVGLERNVYFHCRRGENKENLGNTVFINSCENHLLKELFFEAGPSNFIISYLFSTTIF